MHTNMRALVLAMVLTLIPALPILAQDVAGTWQMTVELDVGSGEPTFIFTQNGETLGGTYEGTFGSAEITGTIKGDQIEFWFETQGTTATYTGTVGGDTMKGACDYGEVGSGVWEGERVE